MERLIKNVKMTTNAQLQSLECVMLIMAINAEQAMLDAGAEPGKDYTFLDLMKLGQPFALEMMKSKEMSFLTEA